MKVAVIGAGPAGASLAYFLRERGVDVEVYEAGPRPGVKPCGWGVPREIEEFLSIPQSVVKVKLRGYRVFLDGGQIHEDVGRRTWGYIVNKPLFLEKLLEGVEVHYSSPARFSGGEPEVPGCGEDCLKVVAAGHYWPRAPGYRLLAIQYLVEGFKGEEDVLELWFDRSMVGYIWVFPEGSGEARVGIGGFKGFDELKARLDRFIARYPGLSSARLERLEGAQLVVSGLRRELYSDSLPVIGEALGTVFPLTGEGIRPAVASAWALARSLTGGSDFWREFESTGVPQGIDLQSKILDVVVRAGPDARAALLSEMPADLMAKVTLGKAGRGDLVKGLMRRPRLLMLLVKHGLVRRDALDGREG